MYPWQRFPEAFILSTSKLKTQFRSNKHSHSSQLVEAQCIKAVTDIVVRNTVQPYHGSLKVHGGKFNMVANLTSKPIFF